MYLCKITKSLLKIDKKKSKIAVRAPESLKIDLEQYSIMWTKSTMWVFFESSQG